MGAGACKGSTDEHTSNIMFDGIFFWLQIAGGGFPSAGECAGDVKMVDTGLG